MTATRTPHRTLTPNRAAHMFFRAFRRSHPGATAVTLLNNGGRSKLFPFHYDGTTAHLAPVLHKQIARLWETAATEYAKAVYGARKNWPFRITITAPTDPLTFEDAAPHLGDHVISDRVYTFSDAAAGYAHSVIEFRDLRRKTPILFDAAYTEALRALRMTLDTSAAGDRILDDHHLFRVALSYTRRNPR